MMKHLTALMASTALLAGSVQSVGDNCSQQQKDLTNKLQNQDVNPAKSCYSAIGGDVLQMDVRNLCPENSCLDYVKKLAQQLPNCTIANKNYNTIFNTKAKECEIDLTTPYIEPKTNKSMTSSGSNDSSSSYSGSGSLAKPKKTKKKSNTTLTSSDLSGSGSNSTEIETTKVPKATEAEEQTTNAPEATTKPPKSAASMMAPILALTVVATTLASALL